MTMIRIKKYEQETTMYHVFMNDPFLFCLAMSFWFPSSLAGIISFLTFASQFGSTAIFSSWMAVSSCCKSLSDGPGKSLRRDDTQYLAWQKLVKHNVDRLFYFMNPVFYLSTTISVTSGLLWKSWWWWQSSKYVPKSKQMKSLHETGTGVWSG